MSASLDGLECRPVQLTVFVRSEQAERPPQSDPPENRRRRPATAGSGTAKKPQGNFKIFWKLRVKKVKCWLRHSTVCVRDVSDRLI